MKSGRYHIRLKSYFGLFIPILFTAVLIYYMLGSRHIMHTDAMLMMKAVAVLMVLSLAFVIKGELVITKIDDNLPHEKMPFFSTKEDYVKFTGFALLSFLYIVAFIYAGFIIATLVFPVVAMFFLGVRSVKVLIFTPILLTAGIYIMFKIILMISLPVGLLGI